MNRRDSILAAFFLDLPFLVDSFWRKLEYEANRNHLYRIGEDGTPTISPRKVLFSAHFVWFLLLIVFIGYGPTHAPLCGVGGDVLPRVMYGALALVSVGASLWVLLYFGRSLLERSRERLINCNATALRRRTLWAVLILFVAVGVIAFFGIAVNLANIARQDQLCNTAGWYPRSIALLLVTILAIGFGIRFGRGANGSIFWMRRQPILTIALAALTWTVIASSSAKEADGLPYRQTYALAAAAMFIIALLAARFARRLMKHSMERLKADFVTALRRSELFVQREDPDLSVHRVWHAIINGAVYQPLLLLLMPSMIAIVVPDRYLYGSCAAVFALSVLLLAWGSISTRWHQMVLYVRRWFLTGTPFAVSMLVIALAGARLSGNQYVATVLAAAPFGAIFMWIVMIYALLWLYEHVVNQALGVQLLTMLSSSEDAKRGYTPYAIEDFDDARVSPQGRYLALHGAGRFAVVGKYDTAKSAVPVFHTYGYSELFAALAARAALLEQTLEQPGLARRLAEGAREIDRRSKLYFNLVNAALLLLVSVLAVYSQHHDRNYSTETVVTATNIQPSTGAFDLAEALSARARAGRPVFIVAASGGGSRAALYTASALEGLAQLGITEDVVLVSGVSGGGVALAEFAMHRDRLPRGQSYETGEWGPLKDRLSQPFIQDVIEGAMEWRLVGATPLSALLVESFERRLNESSLQLEDLSGIGIILNTSISGHPPEDSIVLSNAIQPREHSNTPRKCISYSYLSGSRLVFTNVRATAAFPRFRDSRLPDVDLPYVLVEDPQVSVAAAAALNANFPPVFPNARVDIEDANFRDCGGKRSYYVTDGGATENLGLISALYALHSALIDWPTDTPLPDIHVIALEASASDFDYRQDRGISTATGGAKERLAGGLTDSLLRGLQARITAIGTTQPAKLDLHYLAMPLALRSRGGIGTHWMLASDILVTNPHRASPVGFLARQFAVGPGASDRVRITRAELFQLLDAMHSPDGSLCSGRREFSRNALKVARWICESPRSESTDMHVQEWGRLIALFGRADHNASANVGLP